MTFDGVLSFWKAMALAESGLIISIILHDAIAIAQNRCSCGWAAQFFRWFAEHGKCSPWVAGAPAEVQLDKLQLPSQRQQQAAFDAVPLNPPSCPGPEMKLCTYRRWFPRPADQICPVNWEVPMSTAKLQRILRFRMGPHLLPIEQGCFHQGFEGLAIGLAFMKAEYNKLKYLGFMLAFVLVTLIGICIGIGLSTSYNEDGKVAMGFEGAFTSASAGILIYNALVDLLMPAFLSDELPSKTWQQLLGFPSVFAGYHCMAVLAIWA